MFKLWSNITRLSIRFATLGGLAGPAVFLAQGMYAETLWCVCIAAICIVTLNAAIGLGEALRRKLERVNL